MPNPSRTVVLLPSAARTTTGTGSAVVNIEGYTSAIIRLEVTTATGTSPTWNVRIQQGILVENGATNIGETPPAGASINWDDFASFAQVTATGNTRFLRITGGSNVEAAASANALAAATVRNGPLGSLWRVVWTIGGTNPNFTGDVVAQLIP